MWSMNSCFSSCEKWRANIHFWTFPRLELDGKFGVIRARGVDHTGQLRHHPSASPAVIECEKRRANIHFWTFPRLELDRKFGVIRARGVDHTGQFRQHMLASPAVIMRKVEGQHLYLHIIPNNFTAGTGRKVWCDQGTSFDDTCSYYSLPSTKASIISKRSLWGGGCDRDDRAFNH